MTRATYWTPLRMFEGRTVAVLASGPSMSQAVADRVKHLPRIAVNTTYELARDADIVYACDRGWWARHPDALKCNGIKLACEPIAGHLPSPAFPDDVFVLRNGGVRGFHPVPGYVNTLNNSGGQAIQVAIHAGAARVILLGFDMRGRHWHGDEAGSNFNEGTHPVWLLRMAGLARTLPDGVEVINCTPGSALTCFPRADLDDVLHAAAQLGQAA